MKYLAIIYNDESTYADATPESVAAVFAAHGAFGEASREAGVFGGGDGLQPSNTATVVRVRDGERLLTDGPFAETKEQIGGYDLLECDDLDDAIGIAKSHGMGLLELRPLWAS